MTKENAESIELLPDSEKTIIRACSRKEMRKRVKHPVISGGSRLRLFFIFVITMLYGLLPWVIFIGFGFLNDLVLQLDKDWAIIPVIIGLTPILVADKVGISGQSAFFATASYPVIGLIIYIFS